MLDTTLDIAWTEEVTSNQIKQISPSTLAHVDALNHDLPMKPRGSTIRLCGCCGTEHNISERSFCPAYGSKYGACGKENHWRKVCRSSKPDKKGKTKGGCQKHPNHPKGKPDRKKHFHSLEARDQSEDIPQMSVPDQLYFHTLSINQVTKNDSQAFLMVEVVSDHYKKPLLLTLVPKEMLFLWVPTSRSFQIHPVTLVVFPLASNHLAPSLQHLVDMLLVIMDSNWIIMAPVNHTHSMLLMLMVQPY